MMGESKALVGPIHFRVDVLLPLSTTVASMGLRNGSNNTGDLQKYNAVKAVSKFGPERHQMGTSFRWKCPK